MTRLKIAIPSSGLVVGYKTRVDLSTFLTILVYINKISYCLFLSVYVTRRSLTTARKVVQKHRAALCDAIKIAIPSSGLVVGYKTRVVLSTFLTILVTQTNKKDGFFARLFCYK